MNYLYRLQGKAFDEAKTIRERNEAIRRDLGDYMRELGIVTSKPGYFTLVDNDGRLVGIAATNPMPTGFMPHKRRGFMKPRMSTKAGKAQRWSRFTTKAMSKELLEMLGIQALQICEADQGGGFAIVHPACWHFNSETNPDGVAYLISGKRIESDLVEPAPAQEWEDAVKEHNKIVGFEESEEEEDE